jgi:SWI/SNF-related matrix-associated actin-dependent regulator of chromatin subfamily A member 5
MLDRLLIRLKGEGSRVLLFSQWTETLDILEEYMTYRFGPQGEAYHIYTYT